MWLVVSGNKIHLLQYLVDSKVLPAIVDQLDQPQ